MLIPIIPPVAPKNAPVNIFKSALKLIKNPFLIKLMISKINIYNSPAIQPVNQPFLVVLNAEIMPPAKIDMYVAHLTKVSPNASLMFEYVMITENIKIIIMVRRYEKITLLMTFPANMILVVFSF